MSATSKSANANQEKQEQLEQKTENKPDPTVEVLYQKLGDKWYAFSIIGEEVFFLALFHPKSKTPPP